jgi:DNA topoisomerase-2
LLSTFRKYLPHLIKQGKIIRLITPIIALYKGSEIKHFFFTLDEFNAWQQKNDVHKFRLKYFKGLGSWSANDLAKLIEDNGLDKFLVPFTFDDEANETILNWFVGERVQYRKDKLLQIDNFSLELV